MCRPILGLTFIDWRKEKTVIPNQILGYGFGRRGGLVTPEDDGQLVDYTCPKCSETITVFESVKTHPPQYCPNCHEMMIRVEPRLQ